jgi:signal peptidase II
VPAADRAGAGRPAGGRLSGPARWVVAAVVALAALALDQAVKRLVVDWLAGDGVRSWWLAGDWLGLQYVENRGAAFGTFDGLGALLTPLALLVIAGTVWLVGRVPAPSPWLLTGLGLVVGGALGNVLDRVRLGYVVDFVAVGPWPRFNVADSAITVGVLLLVVTLGGAESGGQPASTTGEPAGASRREEGGRPERPGGSDG